MNTVKMTTTGLVHAVRVTAAGTKTACSGRALQTGRFGPTDEAPTCKACSERFGDRFVAPEPEPAPEPVRAPRVAPLAPLLAAGAITPGQELVARYKGLRATAVVTEDGLELRGLESPLDPVWADQLAPEVVGAYRSPSGAAQAIKSAVGAKNTAANGWTWWKDEHGATLANLRSALA